MIGDLLTNKLPQPRSRSASTSRRRNLWRSSVSDDSPRSSERKVELQVGPAISVTRQRSRRSHHVKRNHNLRRTHQNCAGFQRRSDFSNDIRLFQTGRVCRMGEGRLAQDRKSLRGLRLPARQRLVDHRRSLAGKHGSSRNRKPADFDGADAH